LSTDKTISSLLNDFAKTTGDDNITLFELKETLHEKGIALFMLFFSLPLTIPLPVPPGYTTILALPLLIFSVQLLFGGTSLWLPNWLAKKSVKRKTLAYFIEKTSPLLKAFEKITRQRFSIFNTSMGEKFYGLLSFVCAVSIAIPLPLTNFIPAGGIALMSLGILNRDGLMVILGIIVSFIGLFITGLVLTLGHKVVTELLSLIF
jgi:hypothetical protein